MPGTRRSIPGLLQTEAYARAQAVIERQTGGAEVTREQIDHLLECAKLPNVDIQIMPTIQPLHAGTDGPFRLLETEDNEWLGYSEGQKTGFVISDAKAISVLHQRYAKLRIRPSTPPIVRAC